jgi:hypothetical protein
MRALQAAPALTESADAATLRAFARPTASLQQPEPRRCPMKTTDLALLAAAA